MRICVLENKMKLGDCFRKCEQVKYLILRLTQKKIIFKRKLEEMNKFKLNMMREIDILKALLNSNQSLMCDFNTNIKY